MACCGLENRGEIQSRDPEVLQFSQVVKDAIEVAPFESAKRRLGVPRLQRRVRERRRQPAAPRETIGKDLIKDGRLDPFGCLDLRFGLFSFGHLLSYLGRPVK
jgi:hypothetical protein